MGGDSTGDRDCWPIKVAKAGTAAPEGLPDKHQRIPGIAAALRGFSPADAADYFTEAIFSTLNAGTVVRPPI